MQNEELYTLLTTLTNEIHQLHEDIHSMASLHAQLKTETSHVDRELQLIKLAILNDNIIG